MSMLIFQIPVFLFGGIVDNIRLEDKKVNMRVGNPADIQAYYPTYQQPGAMVLMQSGKEFITDLTCEQLDRHITGFYKALGDMAKQDTMKASILIPSAQA